MYNVTQNYITALKRPSRIRRITGRVGDVSFTEANIIENSLNVFRACAEGNDIILGSVYLGELTCIFKGINLTGQWKGKQITLSEGLLIGENTWEDVPLGVFTVYEANHTEQGVFVTAYDDMKLLDVTFPFGSVGEGQPWDYLHIIQVGCGITLAQTEDEIKALPNGTRGFVLNFENDIETYRDLLYWLAQTMGCFATFNREGKLELREYGEEPVYSMPQTERWQGSSFSDFVTKYTSISLSIAETGEEVYRSMEIDNGLTYNMGANPFLQNGIPDNALDEILGVLTHMQYTPFQTSRAGIPMLDLGDVVTFLGGIGAGKTGCVMRIDYTFHGECQLQGFGSNPALIGVRSADDKALTGAMKRTSNNEIQFYTTTNAKDITIRDEFKQIIHVRFGSMKATIVTFHAEVKLEATITDILRDAIIASVKYVYNNVQLEYEPVETWIEGKHLLHLLYYFPVEGAAINELSVSMECDGEILIKALDIQACLWGQGLVATDKWDGYIEAEDNIIYADFGTSGMTAEPITEDAEVALADVIRIDIDESIEEAALDTTPKPEHFGDAVYINKKPIVLLTWGAVKDMEWGADGITDGEDSYSW